MANLKITGLTATTAPVGADLIEIVQDVATTPVNKKITVANLIPQKATALENVTGTDDAKYLTALANVPAFNNSLSRQAIINGNFDVWQRGVSLAIPDAAQVFVSDRWRHVAMKDGGTPPTLTYSREILTSGDIPNSYYYSRLTTNGAGSSLGNSSYYQYLQKIENGTRYLCGLGKKVTVSFYARSSIANKRLGIQLGQYYGTGGSPSTGEKIITQAPITLTSTWTKYTVTFTTNTLSGKTFGTANDDVLILMFYYAWGTTIGNTDVYPSVTAESYVGSGTIDIAQVQLCAGDVALPFMPKSFDEELRACQRYYQKSFDYATAIAASTGSGALNILVGAASTGSLGGIVNLPVQLRTAVTPTMYDLVGAAGKCFKGANGKTGATANNTSKTLFFYTDDATSSNQFAIHWTADAEL